MDNDALSGLGAGFKGFAQGLMDVEDRKYKRMEMDAKLAAQKEDRERQRAEDAAKKAESEYKKKKDLQDYAEKFDIPDGVEDITQLPLNQPYSERYLKMLEAKASIDPFGTKSRPTEGEFNAAGFASRMGLAESQLEGLLNQGFDPSTMGVAAQEALPEGGILGKLAESQKDPRVKQYQQAKRNFVTANLRKESGAAISPKEYAEEEKKYFPQPGDGPEVVEQKRMARAQAMMNLRAQGDRANARIPQAGLMPKGLMSQGLVKKSSPAASGPKPGTVEDGYRFKGGDPKNQKNWEKVK